MAEAETAATLPAAGQTGDGIGKRSDNHSSVQAIAALMLKAEKQAQSQAGTQSTAASGIIAPEAGDGAGIQAATAETQISPEIEPAETTTAEEPNTEAAAATSPEGDDDDVLSPTSTLDPATKEKLNKRVGKEVVKRKQLEAQLGKEADERKTLQGRIAELESQIATKTEPAAQTPPVLNGEAQPLANIGNVAELAKLQQEAKAAIRYAEETLDTPAKWRLKIVPLSDPDTGEAIIDPSTGEARTERFKVTKLGDQEVTEADMKAIMRRARITLEDQIPARTQFLQLQDAWRQKAVADFPFLTDKSSPDYQAAQAARRANPWLAGLPQSDWIIGVQVEGLKAIESRKAKAKGEAETKAKAKVPPKAPADQTTVSASTAAPRSTAGSAKTALAAEREKLLAKRGVTGADAVSFLQRTSSLRNSR